MRGNTDELTMLLVAEGERLAPALRERLVKHGLNVHDCAQSAVANTAFVVAPDLVVLAGTAAEDGGIDVLAALAARPATAGLPVVLIGDAGRLGDRTSTFRHGIVAVIERTASADELARRIAEVAQELPERTGEASGAVDAGGVQALVELLAESLRTGILSVTGPDGVSARVVLRADRPASEVIAQIVERLRPLADAQSGVRYEFHESPTGKFGALDLGGDDDAAALAELPRSRLLLIEQNPARADLLAQGLRAHGARVAVADGLGRGLELARELTPDVVVVDGSAVDDWALEALRMVRRDPSLRWASLLLVEASQLWRDARRPDLAMLAASIGALMRSDRELVRRVLVEQEVGTRLEVLGPVRTLRALADTKLGVRMRVQHPRIVIEIDLSDGIVVGASARLPHAAGTAAEGPAALATFLGLSSGRVQIERAEAPRSTNIMAPVDDALASAGQEEPVVALSQPPPSMAPPEPKLPAQSRLPREAGDVARLVTHLEQLLGELREHTEPSVKAAPVRVVREPAPPEESTSTVGIEEIARLRRQMRDSSQRLLAVVAPPNAALPAPPGKMRKQTLVGVPIEVELPPAPVYVPKALPPAAPAETALARSPRVVKPTLIGAAAVVALPPQAAPGGPAPTTPSAQNLAPSAPVVERVALPAPAAKSAPLAPAAKPAPLAPAAKPAPSALAAKPAPPAPAAKPAPPAPAARPAPFAFAESAAEPVEPLARLAGERLAPLTSPAVKLPPPKPASAVAHPPSAEPASAALSEQGPVEVVIAEFESERSRTADAPTSDAPPPPAQPPGFFSLMGPNASVPSSVGSSAAPQVVPAAAAHAPRDGSLPPLAPSDATPVPQRVLAPRRGSKLPLVLAASAVVLTLLVGLGFFVRSRLAGDETPIAPIVVGGPLPPLPVPPAPLPLAAGPTPTPRSPAQPQGPALGPGPDEPIEGSDATFELGRLGIRLVSAPRNPGARGALFARLLRDANQARRAHRLDVAEQIYLRVLGMDAEMGRATAGLALIHLERRQAAEAIFWAQRLVRLNPIYASNWVLLGDTLRLGNNVEGARRAYQRAIVAEPRNQPAQQRLEELAAPTP